MKLKNLAYATACLGLLVAALSFVVPTKEADALPSNETEHVWLDANGYPVGNLVRDCSGNHYFEGVRTDRRLTHTESCQTSFGSTGCYLNGSPTSCSNPEFYDACVELYGALACE